MLSVISRGEFLIHGFRNQDVRKILYPGSDTNPDTKRKACAQISRRFCLLRAHNVIYKVTKTNQWYLTKRGKIAASMVSKLRESNLLELAA